MLLAALVKVHQPHIIAGTGHSQVQLGMRGAVRLVASFNRPNITYEVVLLDAQRAVQTTAVQSAALARLRAGRADSTSEDKDQGFDLGVGGDDGGLSMTADEGREAAGNVRLERLSQLMATHVMGQPPHGRGDGSSGGRAGQPQPAKGCAIVYVHRRADASGVVAGLRGAFRGLRVEAYHAGLPAAKREVRHKQTD